MSKAMSLKWPSGGKAAALRTSRPGAISRKGADGEAVMMGGSG